MTESARPEFDGKCAFGVSLGDEPASVQIPAEEP
jgi:hypothetical protein